jgi:hypothetical protein
VCVMYRYCAVPVSCLPCHGYGSILALALALLSRYLTDCHTAVLHTPVPFVPNICSTNLVVATFLLLLLSP